MIRSKIFSLVLIFSTLPVQAKWFSSFDETASSLKIENQLQSLSLEQKVGQLFIFGFHGKKLNSSLKKLMQKTKPGGVILFSRNIHSARQLSQLNRSLQSSSIKNSKVPLLIALDQEGGTVSRIKTNPKIPSALAIGQTKDETIAERMGYLVGKLLYSLGVNMNLAPVLDLSNPYKKSFIGTRSFGNNPKLVSRLANAYAQGLEGAGVLATGKHFPGHGNLKADSHHSLPIKKVSLPELMSSDLMPFSLFMQKLRAPAIMVAHVAFPQIDQTRAPATFSKPILQGVLRSQLNYDGLIVTDDIEMAATQGVGSFEERAIRAIQAGADLVMVAWSQKSQYKAYQAVLKAVKEKRISLSTLNSAVRRVLKTKSKYLFDKSSEQKRLAQFRKIMKSSYFKHVTDLVLEKNFYQSLGKLKEKSFIYTKEPIYFISAIRSVATAFQKESKIKTHWIPIKTKISKIQQRIRSQKKPYLLYYVTGKYSAKKLQRLPKELKKRTLVVNTDSPALLSKRNSYLGVIDIFSSHPRVGKLVAENLVRRPALNE